MRPVEFLLPGRFSLYPLTINVGDVVVADRSVRWLSMTNRVSEFSVRAARMADLARLRALIEQSVRGLSLDFYDATQIESALRFVFGPDTQLIADRSYYVVEHGTTLAAAGGWSRRLTLYGGDQMKAVDDRLLDSGTEPARIRAFFVHPSYARRGLGRLIFERCAQDAFAAGFRVMELVATLPGEPLYRALGFVEVERTTTCLPDGVSLPLVRMRRTLAE